MGVVISVVSAKGGVGKTTFVTNVGVYLAKFLGKRVLAIDGNITTPNLGLQLGLLFPKVTLHDVLNDVYPISASIYVHESGLNLIPASFSIKKYASLDRLGEKIEEIKNRYDLILIDGAAGIGDEVVAAIRSSDLVIVITTPEITSIVSAMKAIEMARSLNAVILGIVLNKVMGERYEMRIEDIEEISGTKVIATIPFDKKIPECISKKVPIVIKFPNSPASKSFKLVAEYLVGKSMEVRKPSFIQRIIGFLKKIFRFKPFY